jgi:hypothetical protein
VWIDAEEMLESAEKRVVSWPARDEYAVGADVVVEMCKNARVVVAKVCKVAWQRML